MQQLQTSSDCLVKSQANEIKPDAILATEDVAKMKLKIILILF